MTVLYPVATSAQAALQRPLGRAAREREAASLAGEGVSFVSEFVGPSYPTREGALDAYAGRLDDDREGRRVQIAPEDGYCALREIASDAPPAPREPAFAEGRRWPKPAKASPTGWRLSVSYWRVGEPAAPSEQARAARRKPESASLDPAELRALARQPLKPVKPQQPLDVGLFEVPAPEAPHILIPDE
jgi:hypothetical protein